MSAGTCPAGCGRNQKPGHFLCSQCWREVPKELQDDVWRTWRAYSRATKTGDHNRIRPLRLDYQAARNAALTSLR